jgi:hypothetical protein
VRKQVRPSIFKAAFRIHPAMQVFADMRPSLVLVVDLTSPTHDRAAYHSQM